MRTWYCGFLISVVDTRDQRGSGSSFQNAAPKHPRTVRQWMVRFDLAALDGQTECARTDAKHVGGFRQIHPSLRLAPITVVTRDVVMSTKRRHALPSPAIAAPGQEAASVERTRQQIIRTDARERPHSPHDLGCGVAAILPASASREPQFCVDTTLPMNHEDDFSRVRIHVHDHFMDQGADQTFLQPHIRVRAIPHRLQVGRELLELLSRRCRDLSFPVEVLIDARFDLVDAL